MKLPSSYTASKIGAALMLFGLFANMVASMANIAVPNQKTSVIGMTALLIFFVAAMRKYR